jgi:surface antigen
VHHKENVLEHVIVEKARFGSGMGAKIEIDVWKDNSNMNLAQWVDTHESILGCTSQDLKEKTVSVQNVDAFWIDTEGVQAYNSKKVFFKYGNKVFRISYLEKDQGAANEVFQHMLDNFEFTVYTSSILQLSDDEKPDSDRKVYAKYCGKQADTCICGADNLFPCCSNGGNCTWWAWQKACCVWGYDVGTSGNAWEWLGQAQATGHTYSTTPEVDTIAYMGRKERYAPLGHVAWVIGIEDDGSVKVSEMNCWGNWDVQEKIYPREGFYAFDYYIHRKQ